MSPSCRAISTLRRALLKRVGMVAIAALPVTWISAVARAATVTHEKLQRLQERISGKIVVRDAPDYELARQSLVWQMVKPPRAPEVIIHARSVNDVVEVVKMARATGSRVAIRCGGHSYDASFLEDGTILVDISLLREVSVDKAALMATAQPGVRSVDFVDVLAGHDLAFPAAHCGNVPLGGFLLGGGLGWNGEEWGGISCLNITGVEVVTADGEIVYADAAQNADLYWAARGGGPNFPGIVTRFRLRVFPRPAAILTSTYTWPLEHAVEITGRVRKLAADMPASTEILVILAGAPAPRPAGCNAGDRVLFVQATAFAHSDNEGRGALEPLADMASGYPCLSRDEFKPTTLGELYQWDATAYPQWRWAVDCLWTDSAPESFMERLAGQARVMPSDRSSILLLLKPHTRRLPDAAFSMIGTTYVAAYAIWGDPDQDAANRAWVDRNMELMAPDTRGHYINESAYVLYPGRNAGSYSPAAWERLRTIKRKRDPENLFHTWADRVSRRDVA